MSEKDFYSDLTWLLKGWEHQLTRAAKKKTKKKTMHASLTENRWKMSHSMLDYIYCSFLILSTGLLLCSPLSYIHAPNDSPSFCLYLTLSNCKEWQQCKNAPTYCKYTKDSSEPELHKATHTHTHKDGMSTGIDGWKYKYCCTQHFIIISVIKLYSSSWVYT